MLLTSVALAAQLAAPAPPRPAPTARVITPWLAFPEAGVDDPAAYQGYQTRLFKDFAGNTLQVYVDRREGRIVHLLANADNEAIGLTARTGDGQVPLDWGAGEARVAATGRRRSLSYPLRANSSRLVLGGWLLGSMRVERDYQYEKRHQRPFSEPFEPNELTRLADAMERLDAVERRRHMALLGLTAPADLRRRLRPSVREMDSPRQRTTRVVQPSLDGRDTLWLEVRRDPARVRGRVQGDSLVLEAIGDGDLLLEVEVGTTARALHPLGREEIFTPEFLAFLRSAARDAGTSEAQRLRARWLERQVRGVELLASREKLMAGLPTYATYFGRDMLVTALMMRSIWRDEMSEFAVASALRKLGPDGGVSHEEALGGQAVREAAAEYVALLAARDSARDRGDGRRADSLLARARTVLRDHRRVRENYHMIDDELQLPILVAGWLAAPGVSQTRKRAFLRDATDSGEPRLRRLLRELALVARMTAPYAESPAATSLISFPRRPDGRWAATSWRDSNAGYGNGRFAMDVNAIWAPHALRAAQVILESLQQLGFTPDSLRRALPGLPPDAPLARWIREPSQLQRTVDTWLGAGQHFVVRLGPAQVAERISARLSAMPAVERAHWRRVLDSTRVERDSLVFLALALDSAGVPLGVVNSDVATRLFLGDPVHGGMDARVVRRDVRQFVLSYPVGLFIDGVGPVVSNDAFAPAAVWQEFVRDPYHGPRVAWGREVNLFLLGAARQANATERRGMPARSTTDGALVAELKAAARAVTAAVEASGFQSELWSYDFINGAPRPVRYGSGADVQLWSTTDLAVQFVLSRLGW